MKKYKVVTDNLKWANLSFGDLLVPKMMSDGNGIFKEKTGFSKNSDRIFSYEVFDAILKIKPDYFEEIKEEPEIILDKDINGKIVGVKRGYEHFKIGDYVAYKYKDKATVYEIDNFFMRNDGIILARSKDNIIVEDVMTIERTWSQQIFSKQEMIDFAKIYEKYAMGLDIEEVFEDWLKNKKK